LRLRREGKGGRHDLKDSKDFAPFASFFLRAFA